MKTIISILVLTILTTLSFGQTYTYSKLVKKANVQTTSGYEQRIIGTYQGPYRFIFETPNDPQIKKLFTLLNPGQSNGPGLPWYGHIKDEGYLEKDGKLFKKSFYFDTDNEERVMVLIADDFSMIVIFKSDDTIWEYIR